ncbi:MAG: KilA-N domain-containing protein [Verrucomicrobia bacterium]|nr:KilA-N domain-containing protein [Verrucomicrobiota bacterium]
MSKAKKSTIEVQGAAITILSQKEQDFICLTDIARFKSVDRFDDLIRNWLRNRNTVEFFGVWERLNNPNSNPVEFDGVKSLGKRQFTRSTV